MQNIDLYDRGIHTSSQAARKLRRCCSVFGIKVGYGALTGFETGVMVVLALQINDMILNALSNKPIDFTQIVVIGFLIMLSIVFSYFKEKFIVEYNEQVNFNETYKSSLRFNHGIPIKI